MLSHLFKRRRDVSDGLIDSKLYDDSNFYNAFIRDLQTCKDELIIESPFITSNRLASLLPIFEKMKSRNIRIVVNTRHPSEHDELHDERARYLIRQMQKIGIDVWFTGGHHRKLAIIDRHILWEGSLNILSQYDSCEIMRRITSFKLSGQMLKFINFHKHYAAKR